MRVVSWPAASSRAARHPGAIHAAGLGSMVRDVMAAHGGSVRVDSRREAAEHGTTVTLTLPLA